MKDKKGFTLIELLAVIVLIGVLSLLVIPNVINSINNADEKMIKMQEKNVADAAKLYLEDYCKNPIDNSYKCNLTENEDNSFSGEINLSTLLSIGYIDEVKLKGSTCSGYIIIDGENIDSYLRCGTKYTTPGGTGYLKNLSIIVTEKTINSVTIYADAQSSSNIIKYEFKIDGGSYIDNGTNKTYKFSSLSSGAHTIYLRVTNEEGLTSEKNIEVFLYTLEAPTYSITPSGWSTSKTITITYQERQDDFTYSYSIDAGNNWIIVPIGTTASIVFNTNGTIIGKVSNGINLITSTQTVSQIDNTAPVVSSVVSGSSTITYDGFTITRSGSATDAESGLATNPYIYQISTDGNSWSTKCINNTTNCVVTGLSQATTYYYRICAIDNSNNQSCISSKTMTTNSNIFEFAYTGSSQTFTVPINGIYNLEVWGAQGGNAGYSGSILTNGGKGGYSSGTITLTAGQILNIYVGGQGVSGNDTSLSNQVIGGYNGGGYGYNGNAAANRGAGGGGATDVRLGGTALTNRIIVAGAGAGGTYFASYGTCYPGVGGGLNGGNGYTSTYPQPTNYSGKGGTQSAGGAGGTNYVSSQAGSLGLGGNVPSAPAAGGAGGGAGYYGGGGDGGGMAGGGGSGYIGGVTSGQTIAGNLSMPAPDGGNETGHAGNGYARITFISAN